MPQAVSPHVHPLARATRMLAIVGAALKLRAAPGADPAIREQIEAGLRATLGDAAADLDETEFAPLLTEIEMAFTESVDLFRHPGRTAGWRIDDSDHLQALGRASSHVFGRIAGLAATRPALRPALHGTFLDVGTGVGGIALRAAETCPELEIDGIDIWEPALRLAAANVAASPHAGRIRLRHLDVTELAPGPRYTLAWLPTMYLGRAVVERAIGRIAAATRGGGWLVAALYTTPDDPVMAAMASLRTLRGGGDITQPAELAGLLRAAGYADVEVDVAPLATFVIGRLP